MSIDQLVDEIYAKKKLKKCFFLLPLRIKIKQLGTQYCTCIFTIPQCTYVPNFYFIQPKYDIFRASCFWSLLREKYILNQRGKNIAIMDLTVYMDFHKMIMYKHIKTHVNLSFCLRGNLWYLNKHWQSLAKFGQMV